MTKILEILNEFLKEIEVKNPFNLVAKGGTALSLYYLNHHRESEDLDFDAEKDLINKARKIEKYFIVILEKLKLKQILKDFRITKSGFASTNRYHIKIELITHKTFYSKIDIDFVKFPKKLIKKGQLNLYSLERMFITKSITFINRHEFKDLYDLAYLIDKIDVKNFKKKESIKKLIQDVIQSIQQEDTKNIFKIAFKNVDLKFKNLKESQIETFIQKTLNKLHILINKLKKI